MTGRVFSPLDRAPVLCRCCGRQLVWDDPEPSCPTGCDDAAEGETCARCLEEEREAADPCEAPGGCGKSGCADCERSWGPQRRVSP